MVHFEDHKGMFPKVHWRWRIFRGFRKVPSQSALGVRFKMSVKASILSKNQEIYIRKPTCEIFSLFQYFVNIKIVKNALQFSIFTPSPIIFSSKTEIPCWNEFN